MGMGQTLLFSILPPLAREMGLSELQVASVFAFNAGAWVIFSPIWGRKSDQWGRRPVILIGFLGYAVSLCALAIVTQMGLSKMWPISLVYPLMVLSRLIFGVIGSGATPAAQAYVADRTSRMERAPAMARFAGAFGFGAMVGPAVGGAMVSFGFLTPIYLVAILSTLSGILIWRYLPERTVPNLMGEPRTESKPQLSLFTPALRPFLIASVLSGIIMSFGQQILAYYLMDMLGMSTAEAAQYAGWGLMAGAGAALTTQLFVIPRLRSGPGALMKVGFCIVATAFIGLIIATNFLFLSVAMIAFGIGIGLALPSISAAASLSVGPDRQGAAAGLVASTRAAGHVMGPLVGLALYKYWTIGPYVLAVGLLLLFVIYAAISPHTRILKEGEV